jgi:hypothetical protein
VNVDRGLASKAARIDNDLLELLVPLSRHFEIVYAVRFTHQGN